MKNLKILCEGINKKYGDSTPLTVSFVDADEYERPIDYEYYVADINNPDEFYYNHELNYDPLIDSFTDTNINRTPISLNFTDEGEPDINNPDFINDNFFFIKNRKVCKITFFYIV